MFTSMLYEDYLNLNKYQASVATAIVIGLSSLLIIVGGAISDKYRPRTSIIISSIGVFIGATALVFISDFGDLISFSTFYFILNASYFIGSPATSAMLADRVSPEKRGSIFGALFSLGQVLSVGTPVLFGYLNDSFGIIAAFTFILTLAVIALFVGTYIFVCDKKLEGNE
jgi:MFS family permease